MTYCTDRFTRLDYCQYLISTQINYTLTYFADHARRWSHDTIGRYLAREKITPRLLWEAVREEVVSSPNGYVIFDDTVLDKNHSSIIGGVRRQWSGNAKGVIRGIGVVSCIYVNPDTDQFWILDYRVYDPDVDGKSKIDHLQEMLRNLGHQKKLPFQTVLMDSWYAARPVMRQIEKLGKVYYCPIKKNRLVDDTDGAKPHRRVETLSWTGAEEQVGKTVHLKSFPAGHRVKLFRLAVSTDRTDYIVTNDLDQTSTADTQKECAVRWTVEQFHREAKQVTGIEQCQCRSARMQRNHIGCAMLVWARMKKVAEETAQSIYQVKFGQLSDYLIQQLKSPSVRFA